MSALADRVLIVVFDGLRPDMIAGRMPHLDAFAEGAARYTGARSVFPSLTRVATTAIGSGHWPRVHGIVGNAFHQPGVIPGTALDTSNFGHLAAARSAWGGRVVQPVTLGERLAAAGKRMAVLHGGSAGSAFLVNPEVAANGHWTFSTHGEGATQTPEAVARTVAAHGALPGGDIPKFAVVDYLAEAAIAQALGEDGPDVVLVWFPEPDTSFHYRELGSDDTRAVMGAVDAAFARLLDAATSGPRGARTAVLALSDHGQITTTGTWDIEGEMRAAGLPAAVRPGPADRLALTRGAMGEVRVLDGDPALAGQAAAFLMERDEIGMVFAHDALAEAIPGALPFSAVMMDHPRAPSLAYVMRSDDGPDACGLPGRGLMTGGGVPVGGGMHGGLNRHELATVLLVRAPGMEAGFVDDRPCGLPDIAPSVLALLGLDAGDMAGAALPMEAAAAGDIHVTTVEAGHAGFRQALTQRLIGSRRYLDRGGRL
jgi:hypothetical protein